MLDVLERFFSGLSLALPMFLSPTAGLHGIKYQGAVNFDPITWLQDLMRYAETTEHTHFKFSIFKFGVCLKYAAGLHRI